MAHFIECSSQSSRNPHSADESPPPSSATDGNPFLHAECSSLFEKNSNSEPKPAHPSFLPAVEQHSSHHPPSGEAPVRARSRSPASPAPPFGILGYSLGQLGYIRLIPRTDYGIKFQFQRYRFPEGRPIQLRANQNKRVPVPNKEHIVLSLSNGEVFAILDYSGFLRAIYRRGKSHARVKMNMMSGEVNNLTTKEISDCPVGKKNPIFPRNFIETFANHDTLRFEGNSNSEHAAFPHPPMFRSLPGRPPSDQVLGCPPEELGYVRLIPRTNQNRRFEFRRYILPTHERIRMRVEHSTYFFEPNQEYLVLSTAGGDAFAIMDYGDALRGIYRTDQHHSRVKINVESGQIIDMNRDETKDCPVGKNHPIFPKSFIQAFGNYDSLQTIWNSNGEGNTSSPSSNRQFPREQTSAAEAHLRGRPSSASNELPIH